jgi:hypothetical protein
LGADKEKEGVAMKKTKSALIGILVLCFALSFIVILAQNRLFPQPEPGPVPPPSGFMAVQNPMASLSTSQSYSSSRVSSYNREGGPRDNFWIPTTGEEVTLAEIEGPGAITHIWMTHRGGGHDLIVRMYWEGNSHPSVEAPIGDFFGVAMGTNAPLNSIPLQASSEGRSRNSWWYMPFNKSALITVCAPQSEENAKRDTVSLYFYIDYHVFAKAIKDIHYFHARFLEKDPAERGKPVLLAEAEGDGHFVGVVMGHRARTPGWFGEGDDIITVDGKVSFLGTGTEDYFCDAWGFRVFSDLYHGVPYLEDRGIGARLSAYRFHILDPIPFRKSFTFEIEHWPWITPLPNSGRGYYSSVGFWYQKKIHTPWPRLEKIIANEPFSASKGRWFVPGSLEAENLGILSYESQLGKNARPRVEMVMPNLSGDHMLLFDSGGKGKFSLAVPVDHSGKYKAKVYYVRAPEYGIVQLRVNGDPVGEPVDIFLKTDDLTRPLWPPKAFDFGEIDLSEGINVFEFSLESKNEEAEGYKVGIDCLVLEEIK